MLIQTAQGVIINTKHLVSAEPIDAPTGLGKCSASLANGKSAVVGIGIDALERACGVIVPAQPGFFLIEAVMPFAGDEENGIFYRETTIIAFRITGSDMEPVPITAEGEPTGGSDHLFIVQQPNGPCTGVNGWYENVAAFKAQCEHALASRSTEGKPAS